MTEVARREEKESGMRDVLKIYLCEGLSHVVGECVGRVWRMGNIGGARLGGKSRKKEEDRLCRCCRRTDEI